MDSDSSTPTIGGTPVATLRRRTAEAHERVDAITGLLAPSLTLERYGDLLGALASVHRATDVVLTEWLRADRYEAAGAVDVAARMRMPALRRDLDALGLSVPDAADAATQLFDAFLLAFETATTAAT